MPKSDDELRRVFLDGREADREAAPEFESIWSGARSASPADPGIPWRAVAVAAAAVAVVTGVVWGFGRATPQQSDVTVEVAETSPLPDIPEAPADPLDDELEALAAWEPSSSPTDFLLDDRGVLGGGLPSSELDDQVLDFEDLTMMEL